MKMIFIKKLSTRLLALWILSVSLSAITGISTSVLNHAMAAGTVPDPPEFKLTEGEEKKFYLEKKRTEDDLGHNVGYCGTNASCDPNPPVGVCGVNMSCSENP